MGKLDGKVAIVTGAGRERGIGRGIALRLADEGADVVVVGRYRSPENFTAEEKAVGWRGLESVAADIEAKGRQALAITADVSISQEIDQMVKSAMTRFGKIDILVNNAAIGQNPTPLLDLDEDYWTKIIATDLTGPFLCSRAVARHMIEREKGGKIINVSSRGGKQGVAGLGAYCAAKFGLNGLTQVLAHELAPYKINVNAICPGVTGTDITRLPRPGLTMEETLKKATEFHRSFIPLGRIGTTEDVAGVVAFLASSDSDYMTGQALNITGGRIMH